ncbi:phosphoenolpyruvate-protein phosphotransferase [Candidatus Omnitrophus magneticus]|uniref:Phosphoenolpyruvate-protein phosphotransferase n=1 Tax=Candidatus Omnitrophus magneticus TaxID=1609969 RepID=A0A0F0CVL2_9BACT|nr:phosphoenolpyruvate-protein phosphotransferase [Candidatus Omnitrophus magneticus]
MYDNKKDNMQNKIIQLKGIPAAPGIVIGHAHVFGAEDLTPSEIKIEAENVNAEIEKFKVALIKTKKEITSIENKISVELGVEHGKIFSAHLLVLEDAVLVEEVILRVKKKKRNVEFIFSEVLNSYVKALSEVKDEYLRDRMSDIMDVGKRILRNLMGTTDYRMEELSEKCIVIAYDLAPSDTAMMHKGRVLGFATDIGGRTSHTAIMAKSLEIPAVVGLDNITHLVKNGDLVILDGIHGVVIVNPTKNFIEKYEREKEKYEHLERDLTELRNLKSETIDGKKVILAGNIELPEDVASVIAHGGEGIGLYRTEYFFMNRQDLPSEEEQFNAYKSVAMRTKPNFVIVRTLDLGGDKFLSQLDIPKEMNPFLGWRAIRFCLARPDIFKTQLRAILRASSYGKFKLMYPLISGVEEFRKANVMLEEVKQELRKKNIPFDEKIPVGAMIEVPSAAMTSDILAKEAAFFSIGTNDLIQYTLAVDRVNEKIAYLYEPTHPAIIHMIKMIIDNGHKENIPVGLCGEMAGDISMIIILLGLGLDEFSTSPIAIPEVKKVFRSIKYSDAQKVAENVLSMKTGKEIQEYAYLMLKKLVPAIINDLSSS